MQPPGAENRISFLRFRAASAGCVSVLWGADGYETLMSAMIRLAAVPGMRQPAGRVPSARLRKSRPSLFPAGPRKRKSPLPALAGRGDFAKGGCRTLPAR